jgi:hypothetical protein
MGDSIAAAALKVGKNTRRNAAGMQQQALRHRARAYSRFFDRVEYIQNVDPSTNYPFRGCMDTPCQDRCSRLQDPLDPRKQTSLPLEMTGYAMITLHAGMTKYRAWIPLVLCLCATGSFFLPWITPPMQQKPVRSEVAFPPQNAHPRYISDQDVAWSGWDLLRDRHDDYTQQIERDLFPEDNTLVWPDTQTYVPLTMFPAMLLFLYSWYTPMRFLRALLSRVSIGGLMLTIIAIMSIKFTASLGFNTDPYSHTTFFYRSTRTYGVYGTSILLLALLVLQFESLDD